MTDSTTETQKHVAIVAALMKMVIDDLSRRAMFHDASKLRSPEKEVFDEFTPKLQAMTYGSDEYNACLAQMKPALDHHYEVNSHHPEHYRWHCACCNGSFSASQAPESDWGNGEKHRFCPRCVGNGSVIWEAELLDAPRLGIRGMSLLDLVEMLCDWKAATLRHHDGDIRRSIEVNRSRFIMTDELEQIFLNTLPVLENKKESDGLHRAD